MAGKAASARFHAWAPGPLTRLGRKQEQAMTIELIWFIPSRVGVLGQITNADNDPEVAKDALVRRLIQPLVIR